MAQPIPAPERFWPKVRKTETCWLWEASTDASGYGQFRVLPRPAGPTKAHRFAYEQIVGPIPDGLELDHLCRVRNCVNPDHLEPVPGAVNTLRGYGAPAKNARKTHCIRGHELPDEPNVKGVWRRCNACRREQRANAA